MKFNVDGLMAAVVQHYDTGKVLMLGWMNSEAISATRETGRVHFYSRSRKKLWMKGETSGNILEVQDMRLDCDRDAFLIAARPAGPTCHTGATSCFFRSADSPTVEHEDDGPHHPALGILAELEQTLYLRSSDSDSDSSYTKRLLAKGPEKISEKIIEEAQELVEELMPASAGQDNDDKVVYETADLLYHVLVGLVSREIPLARVCRELERRLGTSGLAEKAARPTS